MSLGLSITASAVTLLSTDFTGITINGSDPNQADGVVWTGMALSAPSSLTLENVVVVQNDGELMDQNAVSAANGYFGGNTNLSSGSRTGQWGVAVPITIGTSPISLEAVALNVTHASNSGAIQSNTRTTSVAVTVRDASDSSIVGTATQDFVVPGGSAGGLDGLVIFSSPLNLSAGGVYDVEFLLDSNTGAGHYAAFGSMGFNGDVVPEPGSLSLLLLGAAVLLRRR